MFPLSFGAQSSTCHVVLGEKIVISGYHQVRLPVRVTPTDGSAAVGIFEPHSEMVETHGVLIARSVSPIQSGQTIVQILNPLGLATSGGSLGHHAASCKHGGVVVARHNDLRDIFAAFCRRAHLSVKVEVEYGLGIRPCQLPPGRCSCSGLGQRKTSCL